MRKSGIGWFIGVGLVAILLAIGNLIYTCTRNDGEKYAQQYIDESEYVTLHIPEGIKDVTYRAGSIMTGVLMNSTKRIRTDSILFYDSIYKKYFCVFVIEPERRKLPGRSGWSNCLTMARSTLMPPPPKMAFTRFLLVPPKASSKKGSSVVAVFTVNVFEGLLGRLITIGGKSKYFFPLLLY